MKNIQITIVTLLLCLSCKAQIIDLYGPEDYATVSGAYYKDVNGFHNQYVGTWLFTNGNTSLKLVFQTRNNLFNQMSYISFYEDLLVGEYQYIENGIEKVNTLSNINIDYGNDFNTVKNNHFLDGVACVFFPNSYPKCVECPPNEKRMLLFLSEPNHNGMGVADNTFVIRRYFENGVEKLKVWFYNNTQTVFVDENGNETQPAPYKLPNGEYVLTKQ